MLIKKVMPAIVVLLLFFISIEQVAIGAEKGAAYGPPKDTGSTVSTPGASIAGTITVTSPNGGESLTAGNNYYINWTWPGGTNNVKIEYTIDNGSTWSTIISSTANDGYHYWYIPNTPSTQCKVRISDAVNGTPVDTSDAVFTIKPDPSGKIIAVSSPNGGESLSAGSTYTIAWASAGTSGNVQIEYSTNNFSNLTTIDSSTPDDGIYSWTVPNTPSTNCRVHIIDTADSGLEDWSDGVFSIVINTTIPTVTTNNISSVTYTSAVGGGNVISDGGAAVAARGVCWNTSGNPTVNEPTKTTNGSGTGTFTSQIDGLTAGTTYYVRAYATNTNGTSYGEEKSFTTVSVTYTLQVTSTPDTGVPITASPDDKNDSGNGATNFSRIYNAGQAVTLTAPQTYNSKNFVKWTVDSVDQTGLTIIVVMDANHTAQAVYQSGPVTYTLEVTSTPETGVSITVSPNDKNGNGTGTTNFTRIYDTGKVVTLTAPQTYNGRNFLKWTVDGVEQTGRTISVTMDANHAAQAEYQSGPTTYALYVRSTPDTGVPITVTPNDNSGSGNGTTYFTRNYNAGQVVTLTAPQTYNGKEFVKWKVDNADQTGRTITVTMNKSHTAQAVYLANTYILAVQSSPVMGISISVAPTDNNNQGTGVTEFFRTYDNGTEVTLTAPPTHNGNNLVKWIVDGEDKTNPVIITMNSNHNAQAVYQSPTYTLSVQSSPNPGVSITVTPADKDGNGNGTTEFTRAYNSGTTVTLTAPASFSGKDFSNWSVEGKNYNGETIQVVMDGNRTAVVSYITPDPPVIGVSRTTLNLGYIIGSSIKPKETFTIFNSGGGTLNWQVTTQMDRFTLEPDPTVGTDCGMVVLEADAKDLLEDTYTGPMYITATGAENSPVKITVNLWIKSQASPPLGDFSTPIDGSTVSSSIPVTGWVLGDTGMESVKIYRQGGNNGNNLEYIGDAIFVEGARPDVEDDYPDYPMNYKAGWGYMMLTNFLPNGGNGTFTIHAIATDREGLKSDLGSKTITVDNAHAVKPFGAIDTPKPGETASGNRYKNQGWVLTPPPNSVPIDGTTINVYVDGVNLGHPVYNLYRPDVAGLFPGYANSNGAGAYFYLDTTDYDDGVYTIYWTAADSAGNVDGIGSRYFTINNTCGTEPTSNEVLVKNSTYTLPFSSFSGGPLNYFNPVWVKKGYENDRAECIYPDEKGLIKIETRELAPIVIHFSQENPGDDDDDYPGRSPKPGAAFTRGYLVSGGLLKPLPIGTRFDRERGIFYWQPGPGFIGKYRLLFIENRTDGEIGRIDILINIRPKFALEQQPGRAVE